MDILVKSLEKEVQDTKNGTLVNGQPVNRRTIKKKESAKVNANKVESEDELALGDRAEVVPDIHMVEANSPNEVDAEMMMEDRELAAEMNVRMGDGAAMIGDHKQYHH